jgi:FAD/FMN-containing dehydrogenase
LSPFHGRPHGWAADHVQAAELVTADGELRRVIADRDPDLCWAVRGGKDNFGIATSLEVSLFDLPRLYGGSLFFPGTHAADVLHAFRERVATVPEEMMAAMSAEPPVPVPFYGSSLRAAHGRRADPRDPASLPCVLTPPGCASSRRSAPGAASSARSAQSILGLGVLRCGTATS